MNAVGMIVEYNPFHNGHRWHLEQAKKLVGTCYAIGVMSGNFTQRGEPAAFDKWTRAAMAVHGGVDLVLELPAVFAVRSAQYFAAGGIRLLNSLGIVSHVCFGSENPDLSSLTSIASALDDNHTRQLLRANLKSGLTYAAALGRALAASTGFSDDIVASPNNILAIEYLRAIQEYAPFLKPVPIPRLAAQHHDPEITGAIASATAIRQAIYNDTASEWSFAGAVPKVTANLIAEAKQAGKGPVEFEAFAAILLAKLRLTSLEAIESLPEVTEGLHNKIKTAAFKAGSLQDLLTLIKTKRYPLTRLQRIIVHALLGTTKAQLSEFDTTGPLYARVLAFNDRGRELIKEIGQAASVPIITKTTHFLDSHERDNANLDATSSMLKIDTIASDIYVLGMPSHHWRTGGWDFRSSPSYIPTR